VASLLDKSLLQQSDRGAEEPRLLMLETIREYVLEKLADSGELETMEEAHAMYYLALAEQGEPFYAHATSVSFLMSIQFLRE